MPYSQRIVEFDYMRGFLIWSVSWVHAAFFVGSLSLDEIFYYTNNPVPIHGVKYFLWILSEQLSPACFFILMGVSLNLRLKNYPNPPYQKEFLYKRGIFIALFGALIVRPFFLLSPLEILGDVRGSNLKTYVVIGIFIGLGVSLIITTWAQSFLLKRFNKNHFVIMGLIGLLLIGLSGSIEAFDRFVEHYINSSNIFLKVLIEIILVSGKTSVFKTTFSILPWTGYVFIGIWYANMSFSPKKECMGAFILFAIFLAIQSIEAKTLFPWDSMFLISKYPPSLPLSIVCCSYFLLIKNVFWLFRSHKFALLEIFGKNSFFVYCIHIPFFSTLGWAINKFSGFYVGNFFLINLIWFFGMLFISSLTLKFIHLKKSKKDRTLCELLKYF